MVKDKLIQIRVTEQEYNWLVSQSKYSTVSQTIRNILFNNDDIDSMVKLTEVEYKLKMILDDLQNAIVHENT